MNKINVLLCFCLLSVNTVLYCESIAQIKDRWANSIKDFFGKELLDSQFDPVIHEVMNRLELNRDEFEFRKIDPFFATSVNSNPAHVFLCTNCIFINENFFKNMSTEEQRFIIGHELMHIKFNHTAKRWAYELVGICSIALGAKKYLNFLEKQVKKYSDNYLLQKLVGCCAFFSLAGSYVLGLKALVRYQELAADWEAAKALGPKAAKGGIDFFSRFIKHLKIGGKVIPLEPDDSLFNKINSHCPTCITRIEELKKLKFSEVATAG